jgi:hypothetical protein
MGAARIGVAVVIVKDEQIVVAGAAWRDKLSSLVGACLAGDLNSAHEARMGSRAIDGCRRKRFEVFWGGVGLDQSKTGFGGPLIFRDWSR